MSDFVTRFRAEFLPPDYAMRMKDELRARTRHPEESLIEFVRALQGLYDLEDLAATESESVARAIHQSHPRFHAHFRGRSFRNLDEMAQAAVAIQADILAELRYRPPPPRSAAPEPDYAWPGEAHTTWLGEHESPVSTPPRALGPQAYTSRVAAA